MRNVRVGLSLRYWLTAVVVLVVAVAVAVVWLYVAPPLQNHLTRQKVSALEGNLRLAERYISSVKMGPRVSEESKHDLHTQAALVDERVNARVVILDSSGRTVLADSRDGSPLRLNDYRQALIAATSGSTGSGVISRSGASSATAATNVPLQVSSEKMLVPSSVVVLLVGSLSDVERGVALMRDRLEMATVIAACVALVLGFITAWGISRRLRVIQKETGLISQGDFSASVPVRFRDEIGRLGENVNAMGRRLADMFASIEQHGQQVEVILDTIDDGVMGLDARGRMSVVNRAAMALLEGASSPVVRGGNEGDRVVAAEIVTSEFDDLWLQCDRDGQTHTAVLDRLGHTIEATVHPVQPASLETDTHFVITLRDVTSQAQLEQAQKDFISRASHELKTPLFTLAGMLDIVADDTVDRETRDRCLRIMRQQVGRSRRLAVELLNLSRLDAAAVELHPQIVAPKEAIAEVLAEFEADALERGVSIRLETPDGLTRVFVDPDKLGQILQALLDNAVRFTPEQGVVTVQATTQVGLTVTVVNTGSPIPERDLDRIFERFVSNEPGRTGRHGAGLGLSIARELAQLMHGSLTARNLASGVGVAFDLTLPVEHVPS